MFGGALQLLAGLTGFLLLLGGIEWGGVGTFECGELRLYGGDAVGRGGGGGGSGESFRGGDDFLRFGKDAEGDFGDCFLGGFLDRLGLERGWCSGCSRNPYLLVLFFATAARSTAVLVIVIVIVIVH